VLRVRDRAGNDVDLHSAMDGVRARLAHRHHRLAAEGDHQLEIAHRRVRTIAVGLVHGEDVGGLEDARLDRLHLVAHARRHHHQRGVRGARDLELVLPDPDRLDDHHVAAVRVEHAHHVTRGA